MSIPLNDGLSTRISEAATGRIFMKSVIANFYENQARNTKFCYNWAKFYRGLYVKASASLNIASDTESP
jgi:hypothetical protein